MASIVQRIYKQKLASPPPWLPSLVMYETIMGSVAYGVSSDTSDMDVYGFCIPKKDDVFPHLRGEILGFGTQNQRFAQYQEHHIQDKDARKEYDLTIYSIVKYFQLCMENNPNMIDSLFTPDFCVLHTTKVGNMVRDARHKFLSKKAWHSFKGYAFAQLKKAQIKKPEEGSKRAKNVAEHGWDTKFGYHVVRLVGEVEQILTEGDLDLQRNREHLKAIRRGDMSLQEVQDWFSMKQNALDKVYNESSLRYSADEDFLKQLLLDCLEEHYGSLSDAVVTEDQAVKALREISLIIERNSKLL